jgi:hypothetical protein
MTLERIQFGSDLDNQIGMKPEMNTFFASPILSIDGEIEVI